MTQYYNCFNCRKVVALFAADHTKCPSCGSTNGEVILHQRVEEGLSAGVFYNIDLRTGGRAKKKRQRGRATR